MASKKSFRSDNPALMYITPAAQEAHETGKGKDTQYAQHVRKTQHAEDTHNTDNTQYTHTHDTDNTYNTDNADNTDSETKTKRLNLLLRPSLHAQAQKIAHIKRSSVNDIVNLALSQYIAANREDIARYDQVFGGESK